MFCPNFNIKEVFDGFNNIIESLGGRAMTIDEFKSSELRNLRTGLDYSAMEAAYKLYHRNNGNLLHIAPNGKPSILFQSLLDIFGGDVKKAIYAKSLTYSDEFLKWFGDWINDPTNASKVVDENGEPLVVYHYSDNGNLTKFSIDFDNYFSQTGGTKKAIFFTEDNPNEEDRDNNFITKRSNKIAVFLNIKDLKTYRGTKEDLHKQGISYREVVNKSAEENSIDGGLHMADFDDNKKEHQSIWIVHNPNQIKSATGNKGTFSNEDTDIYNIELERQNESTENLFDFISDLSNTGERLVNGEIVSSDEVIDDLLKSDLLTYFQREILELMRQFNIPFKLNAIENSSKAASTIITKSGDVLISLNPSLLQQLSKYYVYSSIIHELIHAKTSDILLDPKTTQDKDFQYTTKYVYELFLHKLDNEDLFGTLPASVKYALLKNEREFAAEFMSNDYVRNELFKIARIIDNKQNGRFVNSFKRLINKFTNALFNKSVYNTTELQLKDYKTKFYNYLTNTRELRQRDISKLQLDRIYKSFTQQAVDQILQEEVDDNLLLILQIDNIELSPSAIIKSFKTRKFSMLSIIDDLNLRLTSIYTKDIDAATKTSAIDNTKLQIENFSSSIIPQYSAIASLLTYIRNNLKPEVERLQEIKNSDVVKISPTELQYLSRDTFGVYKGILDKLAELLDIDEQKKILIDQYNRSVTSDRKISIDEIDQLKLFLEECGEIIDAGRITAQNINNMYGRIYLAEIGQSVNSPTILQHISDYNLDNPFEDTSWIWTNILGSTEMSENETVRAITHIISKTNAEAENSAKAIVFEGLLLLSKLKSGERMTDLYESDKEGYTGYLIRDLNFGKFYKEYDRELIRINKALGLPLNNRVAPSDEKLRIKFNLMRNKWLSKNCHRKYLNEYYEAWDAVPTFVKEQILLLNSQIDDILDKYDVKNKDGYADYSLLPEELYKQLRNIIILKRALYSKWDRNGNEKKEGTIEYETYKSLTLLNEKLDNLYSKITGKPKETSIKYAISQWKEARNKVIERAGGMEEYEKYKRGEENSFNHEMLDNWDLYNSRFDFKKNEDGESILHKEISQLLDGLDTILDYGEEYNKIKDEINLILSIFRNEMGEVDLEQIPESTLKLLTDRKTGLLTILAQLKQKALRENPKFNSISKQKRMLMQKYLIWVETERFKIMKSSIRKSLAYLIEETGDVTLYEAAFRSRIGKYGVYYGEDFSDFSPYSFATKSEAREFTKYMVLMPNYNWIERTRNQFLNPEWEGEKYEASMIPLREKYDNSAAYEKVTRSESLRNLYSYAHRIIKESNEFLTNRLFVDNYLLPQKAGSKIDLILSSRWGKKIQTFVRVVGEIFGFLTSLPVSDIEDIGTDAAIDRPDVTVIDEDEIEVSPETAKTSKRKLLLQYSTGQEFHIIPQYYTRKLTNPNAIDRNLISLLANYYARSLLYKKRTEIKDKCEIMLDMIGGVRDIGGKLGINSNVYKDARTQMNRRLYDERRSVKSVNTEDPVTFEWSLLATNLRNYTTAKNLGAKPSIAMTAVLSTMYKFFEGALGSGDYSVKDWAQTQVSLVMDIIFHGWKAPFLVSTTNTGSFTTSKRTAIANYYGLAEAFENSFSHLLNNWATRVILDHSIFGLMTATDYVTKTSIAEGILRSYRYVDGEFITRQKIEDRRLSYSEEEYKDKLKKYKKAKSLYSLYRNENGLLKIDPRYQDAEQAAYHTVMKDILNTSQMMDGLPTADQRTAASTNIVGMLFFIHRNYLSVLSQRYWRSAVYSYETERYVNGLHKQSIGFLAEMLRNNILLGTLMSTSLGLFTLGGLGGVAGFATGLGYGIYNRIKNEKSDKKSISKVFKDYYGLRTENQDDYMRLLHKRRSLKLISTELLLHYILFDIFLENVFFPFADDDDNKDNLIVQLLAYCLRKASLETFNQYRLSDLISTFRSASAAQSVLDGAESFAVGVSGFLFPNASLVSDMGLWDAIKSKYDEDRISTGAYQGWNRGKRDLWRMLPYSNFYHETSNKVDPLHHDWGGESVHATRKYYENKVLHLRNNKNKNKSKNAHYVH